MKVYTVFLLELLLVRMVFHVRIYDEGAEISIYFLIGNISHHLYYIETGEDGI